MRVFTRAHARAQARPPLVSPAGVSFRVPILYPMRSITPFEATVAKSCVLCENINDAGTGGGSVIGNTPHAHICNHTRPLF